MSLALAGRFFTTSSAWEAPNSNQIAAQLTEKLEVAVFVLQIESSYSIIGAASEALLTTNTFANPETSPIHFISKGLLSIKSLASRNKSPSCRY